MYHILIALSHILPKPGRSTLNSQRKNHGIKGAGVMNGYGVHCRTSTTTVQATGLLQINMHFLRKVGLKLTRNF